MVLNYNFPISSNLFTGLNEQSNRVFENLTSDVLHTYFTYNQAILFVNQQEESLENYPISFIELLYMNSEQGCENV